MVAPFSLLCGKCANYVSCGLGQPSPGPRMACVPLVPTPPGCRSR